MTDDYFTRNWLYNADGKQWDISKETMDNYIADAIYRTRTYDRVHGAVPNNLYDEFYEAGDKNIQEKRIFKEEPVVDIPAVMSQEPGQTPSYVENQEKYCRAKMITTDLQAITGLPADMLHLHENIFPEGEVITNFSNEDFKMASGTTKYWWDEDVLHEELGEEPTEASSPEYRAEWYLRKVANPDDPQN